MSDSVGLFKPTRKELLTSTITALRTSMQNQSREIWAKEQEADKRIHALKDKLQNSIGKKLAAKLTRIKKAFADCYNRFSDVPKTDFEYYENVQVEDDGTVVFTLIQKSCPVVLKTSANKKLIGELKAARENYERLHKEREILQGAHYRNDEVSDYVSNCASPEAKNLFEQLLDVLKTEYVASKKPSTNPAQ